MGPRLSQSEGQYFHSYHNILAFHSFLSYYICLWMIVSSTWAEDFVGCHHSAHICWMNKWMNVEKGPEWEEARGWGPGMRYWNCPGEKLWDAESGKHNGNNMAECGSESFFPKIYQPSWPHVEDKKMGRGQRSSPASGLNKKIAEGSHRLWVWKCWV